MKTEAVLACIKTQDDLNSTSKQLAGARLADYLSDEEDGKKHGETVKPQAKAEPKEEGWGTLATRPADDRRRRELAR